MVEAAHSDPVAGPTLGLVLECGSRAIGRGVSLGFEVDLPVVPVGVGEGVGSPPTRLALDPAPPQTGCLDLLHPLVKSFLVDCPDTDTPYAGLRLWL